MTPPVAVVVALVLVLVLGFLVPRVRVKRAEAKTTRAIMGGLGPTVDLIAVVLGGGGTVREAVEVVADYGPLAVAPSFQAALVRADGGLLLADALAPLDDELGPTFHPLIGALLTSVRDGGPVSSLLEHLAEDAAKARSWQIESMARRLPVTLIVPLVTCLLPATVVGVVVPLAISALRQLNG